MRRRHANLSVVLVVIGALLVPFAAVAMYARERVIDTEAFADRAVEALDEEAVRRAIEREILGSLLDRRVPLDRSSARSLLRPRIAAVIESPAFRRLFRAAVVETNRGFFVDERDNATVDLSRVAPLVRAELRSLSPRLARAVPRELDVQVFVLRRDEFRGAGAATADNVRLLAVLLPLLALIALGVAIAIAASRARAVIHVGLALVVGAALLAGGVILTRTAVVAPRESEGRLTEAELQDAVGALFDLYLNDLYTWALVIGVAGLVFMATGLLLRRAA